MFSLGSFVAGYVTAALTVLLAAWLLVRVKALSGLEHYGCLRKPGCGRSFPPWGKVRENGGKVKMQKTEIRTCLTCGMIFRSMGKCPRCNGTTVYK